MAKFAFVYHGGKMPESPEEGQRVMAAWGAWYESMGSALIDGGGPAGPSSTVSSGGIAANGGANPVSGLTQVEAADIAAACAMAKGCPILLDNGSVEVVEILKM